MEDRPGAPSERAKSSSLPKIAWVFPTIAMFFSMWSRVMMLKLAVGKRRCLQAVGMPHETLGFVLSVHQE